MCRRMVSCSYESSRSNPTVVACIASFVGLRRVDALQFSSLCNGFLSLCFGVEFCSRYARRLSASAAVPAWKSTAFDLCCRCLGPLARQDKPILVSQGEPERKRVYSG